MSKQAPVQQYNLAGFDTSGWHKLHNAVDELDFTSVKELLDEKTDVEVKEKRFGFTALQHAAFRCNLNIVKLLVEWKARIDAADREGDTALIRAAVRGGLPVIEYLLDQRADINRTNAQHVTPLMKAMLSGREQAVECLLDRRADPRTFTKSGESTLGFASGRFVSNSQAVDRLIELNVKLNSQDEHWW